MKLILSLLFVLCLVLAAVDPALADPPPNPAPDTVTQEAPESALPADTVAAARMTPEHRAKMAAYARFNNIWRFVSFGVGVGSLALILFTGLGARFRQWSSHISTHFFALWFFTILVLVADYLISLPFSIYRGYIVEGRYGFLNQGFGGWLSDSLIGLGVQAVFFIVPVWFLYRVIKRTRRWWLAFSIGAIPFIIFIVVITPIVVDPLFNKFGPLKDKQLDEQIVELASHVGITGPEIYEVDASKQSSKINAYVTGLLGSKRIVLYDTLIRNFSTDEIKFVMAHEMGHYVEHHIWWGVLVTSLFIFFALWLTNKTIHPVINRFKKRFGFDSLSDYASLPLVLLFATVILFVFQPLSNIPSRYMEHRADVFALRYAEVPKTVAISSFEKLSYYNLSDPDPNPIIEFWFYTHPSLAKRIAFVEGWGEAQ